MKRLTFDTNLATRLDAVADRLAADLGVDEAQVEVTHEAGAGRVSVRIHDAEKIAAALTVLEAIAQGNPDAGEEPVDYRLFALNTQEAARTAMQLLKS